MQTAQTRMTVTTSPGLFKKRGRVAARLAQRWAYLLCLACCSLQTADAADFQAELFGEPARIFANIVTQDVNSGYVQINGVAIGLAAQPVWDFGDGTVVGSWFPAEHTYASTGSNYIVKVTGQRLLARPLGWLGPRMHQHTTVSGPRVLAASASAVSDQCRHDFRDVHQHRSARQSILPPAQTLNPGKEGNHESQG